MHGANTIVDPRVKTCPEGHSWESKVLPKSSKLTTMTSVSVRLEEMTASLRFELQSETKDNHQQSRNLGNVSHSRWRKLKRVLF